MVTLASAHGVEKDCLFRNPNCLILSCVFKVVSMNLFHKNVKFSVSQNALNCMLYDLIFITIPYQCKIQTQ